MSRQYWVIALAIVCSITSLCTQSAFAHTISPRNNFILHCSGCHGLDGTGIKSGGIPELSLIKSFTSDDEGRRYLMHVPGIAYSGLSNQDIAGVVNYAVARWGQTDIPFKSFTVEEVEFLRSTEIDDIVSYRRNLTKRYVEQGKLVADYPWP